MTTRRIKLTENTDARNARMYRLFREAPDDFQRHVVLIEWQDNPTAAKAKWTAWNEGPSGYAKRAAQGVPGYSLD